jgi:hypothetical protein
MRNLLSGFVSGACLVVLCVLLTKPKRRAPNPERWWGTPTMSQLANFSPLASTIEPAPRYDAVYREGLRRMNEGEV